VRARLRDESGQASFEVLGMLPFLLLVALASWQLMLGAWACTQASNAARTASRVHGRGGDERKAARGAVSKPLREGMRIRRDGDRVTVRVRIPIVVPGLSAKGLRATRSAELPS
jgi:hypothetical protein